MDVLVRQTDGTAATVSSSIGAATTGRIRPASNNAKSVFPLGRVCPLPLDSPKRDHSPTWFVVSFTEK